MTFWDFASNTWAGFVDYVKNGSTHLMNLFRAVLYALMLFDVWQLTPEQQLALLAIMESVFQAVAAKTTVPATRAQARIEIARAEGVELGVAQASSGGTRRG